jgi:hypothetical protein
MVRTVCHVLLGILTIALALGSMVHPVFGGQGSWENETSNISGKCLYRVSYDVPDSILTNTTNVAKVTFTALQLGGTTESVKTQSIEMQIQAKGKTWKASVVNEVRELKANQSWGPFQNHFLVLDSDFGLNPQEAVTAKVSIIVKFKEVAIITHVEYDWDATKDDINMELRSSKVPTSIDYFAQIVTLLEPLLGRYLPLTIGLIVVVSVSISVTIAIGGRRRR